MTKLQRSLRRQAEERGFTLIELLVVIIILGVLSAVVVFAVRGVGDKGKSNAVTIDARTIRTAEEAYCAKHGRYADGSVLVAEGFLSDLPQYHDVKAQNPGTGNCNGWRYSVLQTAQAGAAPGSWTVLAPPAGFDEFGVSDLRRMPDGSVVAFGRTPNVGAPIASVWSPTTGEWTPRDAFPGMDQGTSFGHGVVVTDDTATPANECGPICNKVLMHMIPRLNDDGLTGWFTFDPTQPSGNQWQELPRHPSTPTLSSRASFSGMPQLVQLRDNPALPGNQCGDQCGKILVRSDGGGNGIPPELYDPQTNTITLIPESSPNSNVLGITAPLPDGRILIAGESDFEQHHMRFFNPLTLQFEAGLDQPGKYRRWYGDFRPVPVLPNGDLYMGFPMDYPPAHPEIYTPQVGGTGTFGATPSNCDTMLNFDDEEIFSGYCTIIGSLPDGRILAYSTIGIEPGDGEPTGRAFVYEPDDNTWSRTSDTPQVNGMPARIRDSELLDPRSGPCGAHCNKLLISGRGFVALFTP